MFLPLHLHTGSDQKVPAPTGSGTLAGIVDYGERRFTASLGGRILF